MKKFLITGLTVLFASLMLASCGNEEPKPETTKGVQVLLNGKIVKNGSILTSKGLHMPETEDDKYFAQEGNFEYDFVDIITLRATEKVDLGTYSVEVEKLGGDKVLGSLHKVCLIGSLCTPIDNNKFDTNNSFELKELNKEAGYQFYYGLGNSLPKEEVKASMSVKVRRADKLVCEFTIQMNYKP